MAIDSRQSSTMRVNQSKTSTRWHKQSAIGTISLGRRADLVRPFNRHPAQQIRIDLVSQRGFARLRAALKRLDAHALHHRGDATPANRCALALEQQSQHPSPGERVLEMQFVKLPHQRKSSAETRQGL